MKTVKEQILSFLQTNPSVYHGGALQRMDFKTRQGTLAIAEGERKERKSLAEKVRKLKRTDDTQMSHDHVYDEACEEIAVMIEEGK